MKIFLSILFFLFSLLLGIWIFPGILLNDKTLHYAEKWIHWETGSLSAKSKSFFEKEIHLYLSKACLVPDSSLSGCFSKIEVTLQIDFSGFHAKLTKLGPVDIEGEWLRYEEKESKKEEKSSSFSFPDWVATLKADGISIKLPKITLIKEKQNYEGKLSAEVSNTAKILLDLNQNGKKAFTSQLFISPTAKGAHLILDADTAPLVAPLGPIVLKKCEIDVERGGNKFVANLDCPMRVSFLFPRATDLPYTKLLKPTQAHLVAKIQQDQASLNLSIAPLFASLNEGTASVHAELKDKKYKFDLKAVFTNFKKISQFLSTTSWAVPEPFNLLEGEVLAHASGAGTIGQSIGEIPVDLETKLQSDRQKLFVKAGGKISNPLTADIELNDVQLVLPPIKLYSPPPILPDSRIHLGKKEIKTEDSFKYHILLHSSKNQTVRLLSQFSDVPIPLTVNLKLSSESEPEGVIQVEPVKLELFRRKARVDVLKVLLDPDPRKNEVHGNAQIAYVDYIINISVNGLVAHPHIQFDSDPPLPEKQVMAVLLFGRSLDALDADELNSVGNARAAFADGAIGLASFYALASTPVESVGYDSSAKVFSAKIKLSNGTSLNIGTDLASVRTLGVRKRLGPHWDINTYLENPFLSTERSLTSFLEWNWRY